MKRRFRLILLAVLILALLGTVSVLAAGSARVALTKVDIVDQQFIIDGTVTDAANTDKLRLALYSPQGQMLGVQTVPVEDGLFQAEFPDITAEEGDYQVRSFLLDTKERPQAPSERHLVRYVNSDGAVIRSLDGVDELVIGEGVGAGTVTLDGVKLKEGGALHIHGGGEHSVRLINRSEVGNVSISKSEGGNLRVYTEEGSRVEVIVIDDGTDDIFLEGSFNKLSVNTDAPVTLQGASVSSLEVKAEDAKVTAVSDDTGKPSSISVVTVTPEATGTKLTVEGDSKLAFVDTSAPEVSITGTGAVTQVTASETTTVALTNTTVETTVVATNKDAEVTNNGEAVAVSKSDTNLMAQVRRSALKELEAIDASLYDNDEEADRLKSKAKTDINQAETAAQTAAILAELNDDLSRLALAADATAVELALATAEAVTFPTDLSAAIYNSEDAVKGYVSGVLSGLKLGDVRATVTNAEFKPAVRGSDGTSTPGSYTFNIQIFKGQATAETEVKTVTIAFGESATPAAPSVLQRTTDSVTLNPIAGAEYSRDNSSWQGSNTFTGLNPGTAYSFYVRIKATAEADASQAADATLYTLPSAPTADDMVINYSAETLTYDDAVFELTDTGGAPITSGSGITSYIGKTLTFRRKAAGEVPASDKVAVAIPGRPAAPDDISISGSQLMGVTDQMEYRTAGNPEYAPITGTTAEITENTNYLVRYRATDSAFASEDATIAVDVSKVEVTSFRSFKEMVANDAVKLIRITGSFAVTEDIQCAKDLYIAKDCTLTIDPDVEMTMFRASGSKKITGEGTIMDNGYLWLDFVCPDDPDEDFYPIDPVVPGEGEISLRAYATTMEAIKWSLEADWVNTISVIDVTNVQTNITITENITVTGGKTLNVGRHPIGDEAIPAHTLTIGEGVALRVEDGRLQAVNGGSIVVAEGGALVNEAQTVVFGAESTNGEEFVNNGTIENRGEFILQGAKMVNNGTINGKKDADGNFVSAFYAIYDPNYSFRGAEFINKGTLAERVLIGDQLGADERLSQGSNTGTLANGGGLVYAADAYVDNAADLNAILNGNKHYDEIYVLSPVYDEEVIPAFTAEADITIPEGVSVIFQRPVTVNQGVTLTVAGSAEFQYDSTVDGSMVNNGRTVITEDATLTVNGSFTANGFVYVAPGSTLNVNGTYTTNAPMQNDGSISIRGIFTVAEGGSIQGAWNDEGEYYESSFALEFDLEKGTAGKLVNNGAIYDQIIVCDYYNGEDDQLASTIEDSTGELMIQRLTYVSDPGLIQTCLDRKDIYEVVLINTANGRPLFSAATTLQPFVLPAELTVPENKTLVANNTVILGDYVYWMGSLVIPENAQFTVHGGLFVGSKLENNGTLDVYGYFEQTHPRVITNNGTLNMMGEGFLYDDGENQGTLVNNGNVVIDGLLWVIDAQVTGKDIIGQGRIVFGDEITAPVAGDVIFTINAGSLDTIYDSELLYNPQLRNIIVGGGAVKPESLPADLTIPQHVSLRVHPDLTLIVPEDITLTVEGGLNLNGTIDLKGTLEIAEGAYVFANNQLTNTGTIDMAAGTTLELDGDYNGTDGTITYDASAVIIVHPGHTVTGLPDDIVQKKHQVTTEAELREALEDSDCTVEIAADITLTDNLSVDNGNILCFVNYDTSGDAYRLDLNGYMLTVAEDSKLIVGHGCELDATNATLGISGEVVVDRGDLYFYSQLEDGLRIRQGGKLRLERDGRLAIGLWNEDGSFPSAVGSINNSGIISTAYGRLDIHTEEGHELEQIIVGPGPVLQFVHVSTQEQLAAALSDPWLRKIQITENLTLSLNGEGVHPGDPGDEYSYFDIGRSDEGIDREVWVLENKTLTVDSGLVLNIGEGCALILPANDDGYAVLQVNGGVNIFGGLDAWHDWNKQIRVNEETNAWVSQFIDTISFAHKLEERVGSVALDSWYDDSDYGDPVNWPHWDDREWAYRLLIGICGEQMIDNHWEPYRMLTWGEAIEFLNNFWNEAAELGWTEPEDSFPIGLPEDCQPDWLLTHPDTDWLLDDLFAKISFPRTEDNKTTTIYATHPESENRYFENITFKNKITIRVDPISDNWERGLERDDRGEYTYAYTTVHFRNCAFEGGLEIIQDNDGVIESEDGDIDCRLELNVQFENCQLITDGITVSAGENLALDPFSDYDRVAIDGVPAGQEIVSSVNGAVNNSSDFILNGIRVTGSNCGASLNLECYADHGEDGDYNAFDHFSCDHTNNPIFARIHAHGYVERMEIVSETHPTFAGYPVTRFEANPEQDVELYLGSIVLEEDQLLRLWVNPPWHDEERGGHKMTVHGTVSGGTVELNGGRFDVTDLDYTESLLTVGVWDDNTVWLDDDAHLVGGRTNEHWPEFYAPSGVTITAPEHEQGVVVHTTVNDIDLTYNADTPHIFGGNGIYLGWGYDDITATAYKREGEGWAKLTIANIEYLDDDGGPGTDKVHFTGQGDTWFEPGDPVRLDVEWNGITIRYEDLWYKEAEERTVYTAEELIEAANQDARIKLEADITLESDVCIYHELDLNSYALIIPANCTFVMDGDSGIFSGVESAAIVNRGTFEIVQQHNWIELTNCSLENYGRLVNNGNIYIESGRLKHASDEVFENSGNIELVGGALDLSGAEDNTFKNVRYMKVVDIYTGGEGDDQICDIDSSSFSALTEDSNWLDYTARACNAAAIADAVEAQAAKIKNADEDRDQYKGFDYYNRLDLYGDFDVTDDLTLTGFDNIWLENTHENGQEIFSTLTVSEGATLTIEQTCMNVNGAATLTIENGELVIEAGQDDIRCGRIELWPDANFINNGTVTNEGEFYIREEWDNGFQPGGQIVNEPENTLYIAHIYDEEQLVEAAGNKYDTLHIREGEPDPDGNHIAVTKDMTISQHVMTDSNSGLIIKDNVTLTLSGPYNYNNNGDISVFGALVLTNGYRLHNHYSIAVGDVATGSENVTALLLVEDDALLRNHNYLRIHGTGLLACENGIFEDNPPEYDKDGDDLIINTLTSEATTLDITGGGIVYQNITFINEVTIIGDGNCVFYNCHFDGGLTCVLEAGENPYIDLFDGCTVYGNEINTVAGEGEYAPDLFDSKYLVALCGQLNGLSVNATVPTRVAMHENGSVTLNGITLSGSGDERNSFDIYTRLERYGEGENQETGAMVWFNGRIDNISINEDPYFGEYPVSEFTFYESQTNAKSIAFAFGELNRDGSIVQVVNHCFGTELILTGKLTADQLELRGIGITDISRLDYEGNIHVAEFDNGATVISGSHSVFTQGREDNGIIIYAEAGASIDVWNYNSGVEVRLDANAVFSPGPPHIFDGNGVFLGWGQEDIDVNLFVLIDDEWVERTNFTPEYLDGDENGANDKLHLNHTGEGDWFDGENVWLQVIWNDITINYMDLARNFSQQ